MLAKLREFQNSTQLYNKSDSLHFILLFLVSHRSFDHFRLLLIVYFISSNGCHMHSNTMISLYLYLLYFITERKKNTETNNSKK